MRYWIGVVSRDHVLRGVTGGFCQLCHGKSGPLGRMAPGDWLIYYSPSERMGETGSCQRFTAIGQVQDSDAYPVEMGEETFYRRNVAFRPCREVQIRPMIEQLTFIRNKQRWGAAFRFGHLEIGQDDFKQIAQAMFDTTSSAITSNIDRN
ncbi:EVE domain-containing protein [Chitinimonas sp. PSY-7]|uniref:EVE domain-containing protein n=1 Tax=Chitinimonas sp. PSY-7 TaxID=3459088 RepID=UPI0040403909